MGIFQSKSGLDEGAANLTTFSEIRAWISEDERSREDLDLALDAVKVAPIEGPSNHLFALLGESASHLIIEERQNQIRKAWLANDENGPLRTKERRAAVDLIDILPQLRRSDLDVWMDPKIEKMLEANLRSTLAISWLTEKNKNKDNWIPAKGRTTKDYKEVSPFINDAGDRAEIGACFITYQENDELKIKQGTTLEDLRNVTSGIEMEYNDIGEFLVLLWAKDNPEQKLPKDLTRYLGTTHSADPVRHRPPNTEASPSSATSRRLDDLANSAQLPVAVRLQQTSASNIHDDDEINGGR